jgi:hypothetical protein
MSEYDIKVSKEELVELLSKKDGLSDLLSSVLNHVLESQRTEHLGAEEPLTTIVQGKIAPK